MFWDVCWNVYTGFISCLLFLSAHAGLQLKDVGEIIAATVQLILQDGLTLAQADAAADKIAGPSLCLCCGLVSGPAVVL